MLKLRIIPVLLIRGNTIVKSVAFKDHRMIGDAITAVKVFSNRKADELIMLDIDAFEKGINYELIRRLSGNAFMPLTVGGGIKSLEEAEELFKSGADKITVNTLFHENPHEVKKIVDVFGSQAVCLSLDVSSAKGNYLPYYRGGKIQGANTLDESLDLLKELGIGELLINSIDRDGLMQGFDLDLIKEVSTKVDVPVIACGGCQKLEDFCNAVDYGADAIAAGSIFHWVGESIISIKESMLNEGYNVRQH
tara:strand:+ start:10434 stop:11183 length:750 start_codon:yes stop_codon:yes gene_type:complete